MQPKSLHIYISAAIVFIGYYFFHWSLITVIVSFLAETIFMTFFTYLLIRRSPAPWDSPVGTATILWWPYPNPKASPEIQRRQREKLFLFSMTIANLMMGGILLGFIGARMVVTTLVTQNFPEFSLVATGVAILAQFVQALSEYVIRIRRSDFETTFSPTAASNQVHLRFFETFAISWLMSFLALPIVAFIFLKLWLDLAITGGKIRVGNKPAVT